MYKEFYVQEKKCLSAVGVTALSALVCAVVGGTKVVIGFVGNSQALFADGMHSLSDLFIDLLVLWAAKIGALPADDNHPYGHKRIETLATVLLSLLLILVGVGLAVDGVWHLMHPELLTIPSRMTIIAALASVIVNEVLFRLSRCTSSRLNSSLIHTHALHHRVDVITSLLVLIGIMSARWGWPWLDPLGAVLISAIIIRLGWGLSWRGLRELVDTVGLSGDRQEAVRQTIVAVEGVEAVHCLRTRSMASHILLDVHVITQPTISVSEGHYIGEIVKDRILAEHDDVVDVVVHIDSEDDEHELNVLGLPPRSEVLSTCRACWASCDVQPQYEDTVLHYLSGKITIEVMVDAAQLEGSAMINLRADYIDKLSSVTWLKTVDIKRILA